MFSEKDTTINGGSKNTKILTNTGKKGVSWIFVENKENTSIKAKKLIQELEKLIQQCQQKKLTTPILGKDEVIKIEEYEKKIIEFFQTHQNTCSSKDNKTLQEKNNIISDLRYLNWRGSVGH